MAYLYQRGSVWWANISHNGRRLRLSTGCESKDKARTWAKAREGKLANGEPLLPRADTIRFAEAVADQMAYYTATKKRDLVEAGWRLRHLEAFFTGRKLHSIGPADAIRYAERRQGQGAANGTINRELALLAACLKRAYINNKLVRMPVLEKLKEAAPRKGFFEADQWAAVRRRLPVHLACAWHLAYTVGWRRDEVLGLEWRRVELKAGRIAIDPGETKNDDARFIYLTPELVTLLTEQRARVRDLEKRLGRIIPWVFPHLRGAKRQSVGRRHVAVLGEPIRDSRRAWATACRKAGVPGMLKHDFRRTAVRNMVNAGIPERVAMQITGHKTRAVFDRYHIVSEGDLQEAARKLAVAQSRSTVDLSAGQEGRK